jgi:two-component system, NtrC family, response regulator AlgB
MEILLIDDDTSLRRTIRTLLETMGHTVADARDAEQGLELLPPLLRLAPTLAVVVITAYATVETAVEAMRRGAVDYLPKPFTPGQLRVVLERLANMRRLQSQVVELEDQVRAEVPEADLETQEPVMRQALDVAFKAAGSDATILLRGESGTGKGLLARVIHVHSARATAPFVTVHCPSLSTELLESELFGHSRGAFTGAVRDTVGKVAVAEGGTLLLDEIGDLPLALQAKLLRLLQDRRYERVGDTQTHVSNVRVLAASNRQLEKEIAAGTFREDLFYRLNVIEVALPPLRQRPRDILPLAEHLLRFFARQSGKAIMGFSDEARAAIQRHPWPGNLRELRNAIERGVILSAGDAIGLGDLPSQLGEPVGSGVEVGSAVSLEALEAEHIRRVLAHSASIEAAAAVLGIDPSTLYRKRKRYGL